MATSPAKKRQLDGMTISATKASMSVVDEVNGMAQVESEHFVHRPREVAMNGIYNGISSRECGTAMPHTPDCDGDAGSIVAAALRNGDVDKACTLLPCLSFMSEA